MCVQALDLAVVSSHGFIEVARMSSLNVAHKSPPSLFFLTSADFQPFNCLCTGSLETPSVPGIVHLHPYLLDGRRNQDAFWLAWPTRG
jgi:hypothetical protein